MGLEGGTSQYEDIESDKMEEPLLDKSELIGRGYQIQSDTVVSLPSSQEGSTIFGYNVGIRPYQDVIFTIIFLLLILVSASFGIYGVVRSNPDYQRLDFAHYDSSHGCSIPESIQLETRWEILLILTPRVLRNAVLKSTAPSTTPIWITLGLTLALSAPFAWALLYLLRVYAKELVYATLPFLVLLPIALDVTGLILCLRSIECRTEFDSKGQFAVFSVILLMCLLTVYVIYANWSRIGMTIRVVKTSAEALHHNLVLLFVLPSLSVLLVLFCAPFVVFMGYAYTNGELVTNPELVDHPTSQCARGTDTPCCVWEPAAWVMSYDIYFNLLYPYF